MSKFVSTGLNRYLFLRINIIIFVT